jgi:hypothetical protein
MTLQFFGVKTLRDMSSACCKLSHEPRYRVLKRGLTSAEVNVQTDRRR